MPILKKITDYGQHIKAEHVETGIQFTFRKSDGLVGWMSEWKALDFQKAGIFTSKFYKNLLGHTDFYLVSHKADFIA